jgi:hypothetical protein
MYDITVGDLKRVATTTPRKVQLDLMLLDVDVVSLPNLYAKFVELIETAIDWSAQELARNPEVRQGKTEDQLTQEIIVALRAMRFDAKHDVKIGGHCDITIEGRDEFLWLGEAKIHKEDYAWLFAGFQQLNTRYSTGGVNQDRGGILIYCFAPRIDRIMSRWKEHLGEMVDGVSVVECEKNPMALRSSHIHERTGRPFNVRHVPIGLYFRPQD